jgi:hypothetical protein
MTTDQLGVERTRTLPSFIWLVMFRDICSSLGRKRRLKWLLRLRSDAGQMPPLPIVPVEDGRVLRHPVVPDHDGSLLPPDTNLEVGAEGQVVVEKLEQGVRLLLLQADDVAGDYSTCQLGV